MKLLCTTLNCFNNETPKILLKAVDTCEFETALSLCPVIRYNIEIWSWLNESTKTIIKSLLAKADVKVLSNRCALGALSIPELKEILFERIENFDNSEKFEILSSYQHPELIEYILLFYRKSGSFRGSENIGNECNCTIFKTFQ